MYKPYPPYIGCMDGALEELDRVLRLCEQYNLNAIIDIHAVRGSQNGLDNSGNTDSYEWLPVADSPEGKARYRHWDIRGADWVGHYNISTYRYDNINQTHIDFTLDVVQALVEHHKDDPVVIGVEPVNEPWWPIPLDVLKAFYWESYQIVQAVRPKWVTLFHDSFRLWPQEWGGDWMKNCDNYAIDTHIYQAWSYPNDAQWFQMSACGVHWQLELLESQNTPIIVGEWSLATDNCAMWLNGFNDNVPGYPKVECERVKCPDPYMGPGQPNAPPEPTAQALDPFGDGGESYVINGTCPRDRPFPEEDDVIKDLAFVKLNVFDRHTHGQFFWNFRTEFEPRWDFQVAVERGWIPTDWSPDTQDVRLIEDACPWKPKTQLTLPPAPSPPPSLSAYAATSSSSAGLSIGGFVLPQDLLTRLSNNIWATALVFFVVGWVLMCVRRGTGGRAGYSRVSEASIHSGSIQEDNGDLSSKTGRRRPLKSSQSHPQPLPLPQSLPEQPQPQEVV